MSTEPPGGLCPIHAIAWYGNVMALRLLMETGKVPIDYQDMYGNTALHYATFRGHDNFVKVCVEEFHANLLLVNNDKQSVLGVVINTQLALHRDDDWTPDTAISKALAAARQAKGDAAAPNGHAASHQAAWPSGAAPPEE